MRMVEGEVKKHVISGFAAEVAACLIADQNDDHIEEWRYEMWYTATLFQPYAQCHTPPYGIYAFVEHFDDTPSRRFVTFIAGLCRDDVITTCDEIMQDSMMEYDIEITVQEYARIFEQKDVRYRR